MSLPQMPQAATRTRTSPTPACGAVTSERTSSRPGSRKIAACMPRVKLMLFAVLGCSGLQASLYLAVMARILHMHDAPPGG
jgi:hypothetical protein